MSISADFGDDEAGNSVQIATNRGWQDVIDWADDLDNLRYPALLSLIDHGFSEDIEDVIADIQKALEQDPPHGDINDTLDNLIDVLSKNKSEGIVVITNEPSEVTAS